MLTSTNDALPGSNCNVHINSESMLRRVLRVPAAAVVLVAFGPAILLMQMAKWLHESVATRKGVQR
jgi:hypothetical protein